jgi:hypothetical protein
MIFATLIMNQSAIIANNKTYTSIAGQTSGFTTPSTRNARAHTQLDMAKISSVKAREILDSRGNPTVEVCLSILFVVMQINWHN